MDFYISKSPKNYNNINRRKNFYPLRYRNGILKNLIFTMDYMEIISYTTMPTMK